MGLYQGTTFSRAETGIIGAWALAPAKSGGKHRALRCRGLGLAILKEHIFIDFEGLSCIEF
jgi:hypothetical protein